MNLKETVLTEEAAELLNEDDTVQQTLFPCLLFKGSLNFGAQVS